MLQTTITGYPRIGANRELKFATEAHFKGKLSEAELKEKAKELRAGQWRFLKNAGIDLIPSNDFSFYDTVLDTAFMLNAVPEEYKDLGLGELDTYFAMARGYQGKSGDVKALSMRKWFNTNYHYIVPRLDEKTVIKLTGTKPFDMYTEALELKIKTKPVIPGPFSFIKLSDVTGAPENIISGLIASYKEIFTRFDALGAEWIQLDEPMLVTDLTEDDIALFTKIYDELLLAKKSLKILLQTYFGDIRDIYESAAHMDFDGYGFDFIEGKQSLSLMRSHGFPKGKTLFAGVIDGRNIWCGNLNKTTSFIGCLEKFADRSRIVISSSCSLLHVPYSLNGEDRLPEEQKKRLAFAQEKIKELRDLKSMFSNARSTKSPACDNSLRSDEQVESFEGAAAALDDTGFVRRPAFKEREKIQKESLGLPLLPLTTIGSFPQTREIKSLRRRYKSGEICEKKYKSRVKEKIASCIALQEELGFDVLVHGEYERNDMVEYFGENLEGFVFTENGWVQSYGTRCVKPPIIVSDIARKQPITVDYIKYAQSLTKKPVKGMLTGPVTILNWSFPRNDIPKAEIAYQLAAAIKEEVTDLEKNGIRIIQIDEAALKEKLPLRKTDWHKDYLSWAIPAFRAVHCGVKPETQIHTHMCYSEFEDILGYIDQMDADVISFEADRSNLSILSVIKKSGFKTQVGPGVYDIHSPRIPQKDELVFIISTMLKMLPKEKLWINPDCGLKTRGEEETAASLKNMAEEAKIMRGKLK